MNAKILFSILFLAPSVANAAIPYRVEQVRMPLPDTPSGLDSEAFARRHRFYVGGMYNFSMWQSYTDDNDVRVGGKNTSSFDAVMGLRISDTFRLEANYVYTKAKWGEFSLNGNTGFVNAIFDARIDNIYRMFRTQKLVPYVGAGAGLAWNTADRVHIENKITPAVAALAGLGIELGEYFTIDLGYRYMYMFTPRFDTISNLSPTVHQFRAGARINF